MRTTLSLDGLHGYSCKPFFLCFFDGEKNFSLFSCMEKIFALCLYQHNEL